LVFQPGWKENIGTLCRTTGIESIWALLWSI
jgi:hypothetical protein